MFPKISPSLGFDAAARLVLAYLKQQVPMGFWSVTRVENGRQTYLYLDDEAYGAQEGGSHPWAASYCVHMAAGTAPAVAPDAQAVPVYAAAAVNDLVTIGSYAGAPIRESDGVLFGAICGIDPEQKADDERLRAAGPLLSLLGDVLSMVLAVDRARDEAMRRAVDAQVQAETDVLTGIPNRRAWERLLDAEQERFRRLADPTVLALVDLDMLKEVNDSRGHAAGDDYIRTAAKVLQSSLREGEVVARLGGDEFGLLLRRCDEQAAEDRVRQLMSRLDEAGVAGSVGWAPLTVLRGFPAALAEADAAMYAAKDRRRAARRFAVRAS